MVLDFWATWCGPCVASLPHWNELALQFRDKPVVFIAISDENKDIVTSFLKRRTISSWVGLEGITQSTRDRYGIRGIPTTIIVNQEGPIRTERKANSPVVPQMQVSLRGSRHLLSLPIWHPRYMVDDRSHFSLLILDEGQLRTIDLEEEIRL